MRLFWIIVGIIVVVILFLTFNNNSSLTVIDSDRIASTTYYSLWGLLLCSAFLGMRIPIKHAIKSALIWLALFLIIMLGYTNRYELQEFGHQITAGLIPESPLAREDDTETTVKLERMSNSSHFETNALVDGISINFMVDTGATNIILSYEDAKRVGIDVNTLDFSVPVSTANGQTMSAKTMIDEIKIGKITRRNLSALISQPDALDGSLLGMNFLDRLSAYTVRGNQMVLID